MAFRQDGDSDQTERPISAEQSGHRIVNEPTAGTEQARLWAERRGAAPAFIELAALYWRIAPQRGGVDPAVAYSQAAKETAFGRFGGVVDEDYHNPAGIKTARGGANSDPEAHQRFASWEEGVTAHVDHLALYAGAAGYPRGDTPDPRHFPAIAGTARTVEELSGRWATDTAYGTSLLNDYLLPLQETEQPQDSEVQGEAVEPAGTDDAELIAPVEAAEEQEKGEAGPPAAAEEAERATKAAQPPRNIWQRLLAWFKRLFGRS